MKFTFDHDLHIHSFISSCSKDPEQTSENILKYAKENNLKTICLANHFWDEAVEGASNWYAKQNFAHILQAKPLPKDENVKFLFGCETELDKNLTLALSPEKFDEFDFIVIPTTHFHMLIGLFDEQRESPEALASAWVKKLDAVLSMNLPFHKIGIAHLACGLIAQNNFTRKEILDSIDENELIRVFTKASDCGVGIELNSDDIAFENEDETESILRIFKTAKNCGCKFYFGSDAHKLSEFSIVKERLERAVDLLNLTEDDKFDFSNL